MTSGERTGRGTGRPDVEAAAPTAHAPVGAIVVVGVLAGFLAGLFGVGGGILIVPGLVLAAGMDQRLAHGTSLAAVLPISIASLVTYATHDNVDWDVAWWLAIGAVAGAVIGTKLLHVLPHRTLGLLFAGLLIVSAVRLFVSTDADESGPDHGGHRGRPRRRRAGDGDPRRTARRRRRDHHGPGDDPAVRHPARGGQGDVGGRDHPDRGDGHVAQPQEGERRPAVPPPSSAGPGSSPRRSAGSSPTT